MLMTKRQAVEELIEGAMRAHDAGLHACAITLAGAAEGAMPPASDTLFGVMRNVFDGYVDHDGTVLDRKSVVRALNAQRDWLKHYDETKPQQMNIDDSLMLVIRSVSRFRAVYGREAETPVMKAFFAAAQAFDPWDD